MAVKSSDLDNPEQHVDLTDREGHAAHVKRGAPTAHEELLVLRQRIATALATTPTAPIPECAACYRRGWVAALRAIDA